MNSYASRKRIPCGAQLDQELMIMIAWVRPEVKRLFQLYPHVLFIDGTASTNNEKRPLITFSIMDPRGNMHVIMRAAVPNEREWVFQWLFERAMPELFGVHKLHETKIIFTDGASSETNQLDSALDQYFVNAKRRRCGFHIFHPSHNTH